MRTKTELFLYMLSWRSGQLLCPTFHTLEQSFEGWAYQNGCLRQIENLRAQGFLEKHPDASDLSSFVNLTKAGQKVAQGGVNPEKAWNRKWDHTWHMILFDLPARERTLRKEFLRTLKANGFGCLQGSVWISPHFPKKMDRYLKKYPARPSRLLHLNSHSAGRNADKIMVQDSWNFSKIEHEYYELLHILREFRHVSDASQLLEWAKREWQTWKRICEMDPMLPKILHPSNYPGPQIWAKRQNVLKQAGILASELFVSPETKNG